MPKLPKSNGSVSDEKAAPRPRIGGLAHVDVDGSASMVDVSGKQVTRRRAVASAFVRMAPPTVAAVREGRTRKGDPLEAARIAGIMAAKRTSELIPLCHTLPLDHVGIDLELKEDGIAITATATTEARTGVEMEAMIGVSVSALTVYDMCKSLEKGITITDIRLESKSGGKSGVYLRKRE